MKTNCLRCGDACQTGEPDPNARALQRATEEGLCGCCAFSWLLRSVVPIRMLLEENGPDILLPGSVFHDHLRGVIGGVLAHTQLREDEINYVKVVQNWDLPFPAKHQPTGGELL